jgi:hypothetical protein
MFSQQKFQSEKAPQPTSELRKSMKGISSQQWKSKPVSIRKKYQEALMSSWRTKILF